MSAYSDSTLVKKLGVRPSMTIFALHAPDEYAEWLGELPDGAAIANSLVGERFEFVHGFFVERQHLEEELVDLRRRMAPHGTLWVSWPKRASKVETDITESVVREVALPLGLVDVKVCAVSEVWTGLKLVLRLSERKA